MMINIFSTKVSELGKLCINISKRFFDRAFSCKIVKEDEDSDDEDDKVPNTKKIRQADLEKLYTGPQIEAGEKFAQMFTSMSITLMYSCGLPVLYMISFVFFVVAYWFNKIMLMRYYQKTYEFNDELPIKSIHFLKFGTGLHFVMTIIQLGNRKLL